MRDVLSSPLFSIFVGAAITWLVAWYYFKRAGDDLKAEARSLHAATSAIAYLLEHPDATTEVRRDEQGRIAGVVVSISVAKSSISFTGEATIKVSNDDD